jgi:hypothetical protein
MAVTAFVDGSNVTANVMEGSVTHELNGRSTATVRMPLDVATGGINSTLYIDTGASGNFWGRVHHVDEQGDVDNAYRLLTAVDPGFILEYRPARDADGDFSKPSFMTAFPTGPQMIQQILQNSITYEGALGFSLGSFATGGVNLSGLPTDWPMTIAEIAGFLTQTGEVDVVMSFSAGGATLSVYNGNYGSDLSGSVSFKYAMGTASNCRGCRRVIDATELMNKLSIYGGPRVLSAADPAGDQHWKYLVNRDDLTVQALPKFSVVNAAIVASRTAYLERAKIMILDRASVAEGQASHLLDAHYWLRESALRANPKTLVHLTPDRGIAPTFVVGDKIAVQAGTSFGGGFSGSQRVYQYTYRWDVNGVMELGEPVGQAAAPALVVSADQEALA